jgi:hypothetical protein
MSIYSDIQIDIINLTNQLNYLLTCDIITHDHDDTVMQLEAELQHWIDIS